MREYERYANELAVKYKVDPAARYYEGDSVVCAAATEDEVWRLACLWEQCHFDGLEETW